jgi:hypothetical protein
MIRRLACGVFAAIGTAILVTAISTLCGAGEAAAVGLGHAAGVAAVFASLVGKDW